MSKCVIARVLVAVLSVGIANAAQAVERTEYVTPGTLSTIAVPYETIIPNQNHAFGTPVHYSFQFNQPRSYGWGDVNGDGLNDIIAGPTYFNWKPALPIQIWLNAGNGAFIDGTATTIAGTVPTTGFATNVFVNDFNKDGRADVFIVDHGHEDTDAIDPGFDGHINILLLSRADGKLEDKSSTLPGNTPAFNHLSQMADVNGDGNQDIVLTLLGGKKVGAGGVYFLIGDGKGGFTRTTTGIPREVAQPSQFTAGTDWQYPGSSSVCDVDGDGRGDLITGSYSGVDALSKQRTVRFHQQQADGSFVEKAKLPIPAALADISYSAPPDTRGLGVHQITCGKLMGSARNDVLVAWEGAGKSYAVLLRNDGNYSFTDVTVNALGGYANAYTRTTTGFVFPIAYTHIVDVDGDGLDDIWFMPFIIEPELVTTKTGFVYLNNGNGSFSPFRFGANGKLLTQAETLVAFGNCSFCGYIALIFDAGGSTRKDLVLINGQGETTSGAIVQSKSVTIRTLINSGASQPSLKTGVIFSSAQASSRSYVRLNNTGTTAGTATIDLADSATGQTFTQWTSPAVPAGASTQVFIADIEKNVAASITRPQYFSMTVKPAFAGSFQHVLWRPTDGTLTNLSTCAAGVTSTPRQLINVHSTVLGPAYPSSVVITNTGTTAGAAQLGIFDSNTGARLGTYISAAVAPGNQALVTMASIEMAANVSPGTTIYHYNIALEGMFSGFLQHLVNNTQVGVITDMSTVCTLGTPTAVTGATQLKQSALFSTAQASSRSYIRLNNTGTTAGTATVTLTNAATAQTYATWTSPNIAAGASEQYFIETLENAGAPGAQRPQYFAMNARTTFDGSLQHVLWRPADGTLTNLTTCDSNVTANSTSLINVHSSLLNAGYPSTVVVANTGTAATTVQLGLYDARNGAKLGTYTTASIPANGQAVLAISSIETGSGVKPGTDIYHYVIKGESVWTGFLQHLVTNQQAGVVTDMTAICKVNASVN